MRTVGAFGYGIQVEAEPALFRFHERVDNLSEDSRDAEILVRREPTYLPEALGVLGGVDVPSAQQQAKMAEDVVLRVVSVLHCGHATADGGAEDGAQARKHPDDYDQSAVVRARHLLRIGEVRNEESLVADPLVR